MDQSSPHGVKNRLKPVMRSEFLINSVKVVAQCRQRDTQLLCDLCRIVRFGEKQQNALLLLRQGLNGRRRRLAFSDCDHLARHFEHPRKGLFGFFAFGDIAAQMSNKTAVKT
jgi:hypothetical protein